MTPALASISVIVVSWNRPADLRRCLIGLQQQDHPRLDLQVVADPASRGAVLAAMQGSGLTAEVLGNPGGNISLARNIGLRAALGDVVAFIDDDAVPEPSWAQRLARAFADPKVVAATGYTRGRNGISWQWTATEVDDCGQDHAVPHDTQTRLHRGTARRAVKPVGTNCAFRRDAILAIGGFDEAYRFYLDDADVGLRLGPLGLTAVVPGAVVHHAFAASDRRRADRVPSDLTQIGASVQVFLRRHAQPQDWPAALARIRAEQAARLAGHLAAGRIDRDELARLTRTLETGLAEGQHRDLPVLAPIVPRDAGPAQSSGLPAPGLPGTGPRPGKLIVGRFWQARRKRAEAAALVAAGIITTLILLSPTMRAHRHRLHPDGYWEQVGGLFGPSDRRQPRFRWWRFAARVQAERRVLARYRPMDEG